MAFVAPDSCFDCFFACSIWFSPKGDTAITGSNVWMSEASASQEVRSISQKFYGEELLSGIEGLGEGRRILRTIELYFGEQNGYTGNIILITFAHEGKILYQASANVAAAPSGSCEIYINVPLEPKSEYTLRLESAVPEGSFVVQTVPNMAASTAGACETEAGPCDGQLFLGYSVVQPYENELKQVWILFLLVLFSGFSCMLWNVRSCRTRLIKRCKSALVKFYRTSAVYAVLSEAFLCACMLATSGLQLQPVVKAVLYLFSAFSVYYVHTCGYARIKELCRNKAAVGFYTILDLYSAFAFAGNNLFIVPLSSHWNGVEIILKSLALFLTALWFAPVLAMLFLWCSERYHKEDIAGLPKGTVSNRSVRLYVICTIMFLVPLCVTLYAYNPAISAWDTGYCLSWVPDLHGMLNWHPPFYVTVMKVLLGIWDSLYCLVFAQWLLWLYVWIGLLAFLRRRGVRDAVLYLATAVSACSVPTLLSLCTLWKDTPYATVLLWVTVIMARLYWNGTEHPKKVFIYVELAVALVFLCLIRQNGIVPYLMTALALLILCYKNRRAVLAVVCSALCVWGILGPYYASLELIPMDPAGKFAGLTQDLMSVYYYEGDTPEEVIALTNERMSHDILAGWEWFRADWAGGVYNFSVSSVGFVKTYIETFAKNPAQLMRTVLFRNDHLWDIFGSAYNFEGNCNYTETAEASFTDVWQKYEKRVPNRLTEELSQWIDLMFEDQLLHVLLWRVGPWTLLLLIVMAVHFTKRPTWTSWLLFVPIIGHIIGIALSAGWSEHRYYWPIIPVTLFILLCIMGPAKQSGIRTENTAAAEKIAAAQKKAKPDIIAEQSM